MSDIKAKCPKCGTPAPASGPGRGGKVRCPSCWTIYPVSRGASGTDPAPVEPAGPPAPSRPPAGKPSSAGRDRFVPTPTPKAAPTDRPGPEPTPATDAVCVAPPPPVGARALGAAPAKTATAGTPEESGDALPTIRPARPEAEAVWDYFDMMSDGSTPAEPASASSAPTATAATVRPTEQDPPAADSSELPMAALSALAGGEAVAKPAAESAQAPATDDAPAGAGDPLIGKTLGGCTILRKLGRGGMGSVYEARQISLDRRVAVKVLAPELAANSEFLERFTREALAAAKLTHHNVVQIYDVGSAGGHHFFTMELVRGETLAQIRKREERLTVGKAMRYILQAARGLEFAHRHGIIHRDIKPANLMLNEQGLIKVADLGLAKRLDSADAASTEGEVVTDVKLRQAMASELTAPAAALGTPGFMAPEQIAEPKRVDARADIYALGATLHQLVTGKMPFPGKNLLEILHKQSARPLPSLPDAAGLPEDLAALLRRMMARDPDDRPRNMAAVVLELDSILGRLSRSAAPTAERAAALAKCAGEYADVAAAAPWIGPSATAAVSLLLIGLGLAMGRADLTTVGVVMPFTAGALFVFLEASTGRSELCRRLVNWIAGAGLRTHLEAGVVLAAVIAGAAAAGLILPLLVGIAAGGAAGLVWHGLSRLLSARAAAPLEAAGRIVAGMRAGELDEMAVQDAVLGCGAARSDRLFEAIFGWAALMEARRRAAARSSGAAPAPSLRDRIMSRLDRIEQHRNELARREASEQERRQAAEESRSRELDARKAGVLERLSKMAEEIAELERREAELALRVSGFKGESESYADMREKLRRLRAKLYAQRTAFETFRRSALGLVQATDVRSADDDADRGISLPRIAAGLLLVAAALFLPALDAAGDAGAGQMLRTRIDGAVSANAVFAGLALLLSGLRRRGWSGALTAIGGLLLWPAAAFTGGHWTAVVSAKSLEGLPTTLAGLPTAGGPFFWLGAAVAGLGMLLSAAAIVFKKRKPPPTASDGADAPPTETG